MVFRENIDSSKDKLNNSCRTTQITALRFGLIPMERVVLQKFWKEFNLIRFFVPKTPKFVTQVMYILLCSCIDFPIALQFV